MQNEMDRLMASLVQRASAEAPNAGKCDGIFVVGSNISIVNKSNLGDEFARLVQADEPQQRNNRSG